MNLIVALLELLRVARAQLGVYHHANLDAQKLLLEGEAKHLKDCHVVWLSHLDGTEVDQDSEAYKGPGWYTTDESGVISSGPHTSFVEAAFESGRYVGAEVGTKAMVTLDLCHMGTTDGHIWVQRLNHFHRPWGPRYLLGDVLKGYDKEHAENVVKMLSAVTLSVADPSIPAMVQRPEGLPSRDARDPEQIKKDVAAMEEAQRAVDDSIDRRVKAHLDVQQKAKERDDTIKRLAGQISPQGLADLAGTPDILKPQEHLDDFIQVNPAGKPVKPLDRRPLIRAPLGSHRDAAHLREPLPGHRCGHWPRRLQVDGAPGPHAGPGVPVPARGPHRDLVVLRDPVHPERHRVRLREARGRPLHHGPHRRADLARGPDPGGRPSRRDSRGHPTW